MISLVCEKEFIEDHLCYTVDCTCFCHTQKRMEQMRDEHENIITAYAETRSILWRVWEDAEQNNGTPLPDLLYEAHEVIMKYWHQNEAWT